MEEEKSLKTNKSFSAEDLVKSLSKLVEGLVYISETDANFEVYFGEKSQTVCYERLLPVKKDNDLMMKKVAVEEKSMDEFFERLIKVQDWYGEHEKQQVQKFKELKNFLTEKLRDLKVFRIGRIRIEIYVVGLDQENNIVGVRTESVET
jgi:hypothetical protein